MGYKTLRILWRFFILGILVYFPYASSGQQHIITGTVTDGDNNVLSGVTILVVGTQNGTITNSNGSFSIQAEIGDSLEFRSIGYKSERVAIVGGPLNVKLTSGGTGLNEVVVVSYGTQDRHNITGAISQINGDKVKDMPVNNIGQKMQGKFAGVQINENSGAPGSNMSFRIRGAASVNAGNSPLIVIDGFPSMSGLESINPDVIESMTVLKDAAAAALYGSRAANGVILITTKQAREGQKSIQFSTYAGFQIVPDRGKPDLMNAREFAQFKKEYYEDMAKYEGYTGGVPEVYQDPEKYSSNSGTNWFDVLLRKAFTQNYDISLTSGKKDLRSFVNLNYNDQKGVMINTYAKRVTARSNNIYTVSDKFKVGLNLVGAYRMQQITAGLDNGRNIIQQAYLMDPTLNYINPDGTFPISFSQPGMFANPNWYLVLMRRQNPTTATTLTGNTFAEWNILDGLKYKISLNANTMSSVNRAFNPSIVQGGLGSAPPQAPSGYYNTSRFLTWLVENTVEYTKTIKEKHNLDILVGYTSQRFHSENSNINASEFPDDNISWINVATTRIGNAGTTDSKLLSYLGRLNYDYNGRYLLSLAFRRDGSSRFGADKKYGNFPSISGGWIITKEDFMSNVKVISFLKIRADYGKVGNNNIGDYNYLSSIITNNYVFNDNVTPGKSLNGIGNSFLTWETTESFDIGLDLELLKGRLSFTYDYYKKKTNGLLYAIDIPIQSGFSNIQSNVGRFDFWGHEFSVSSVNATGKLEWNTDFNISFDRNIVKKLGTNDVPIGGSQLYWDDNRTAVGHPIGLFYGYINTGVYMTEEEFENEPHDATAMVGTAKFKDINGDGVIDDEDRTWIGNPNPKFVYGMTNTFSYKDVDLSFVLAGSVGNDIADDAFQSTENLDGVFNVRKGVADRWRSIDDPGSGIYPRTRTGTTADFRNFTDRQVFKASYVALKNITVGYTLPMISKKAYLKKVRVYFSAQNAFILTQYPGMNPEAGMNGLNGLNQGRDFTGYPIPVTVTLGANIDF